MCCWYPFWVTTDGCSIGSSILFVVWFYGWLRVIGKLKLYRSRAKQREMINAAIKDPIDHWSPSGLDNQGIHGRQALGGRCTWLRMLLTQLSSLCVNSKPVSAKGNEISYSQKTWGAEWFHSYILALHWKLPRVWMIAVCGHVRSYSIYTRYQY